MRAKEVYEQQPNRKVCCYFGDNESVGDMTGAFGGNLVYKLHIFIYYNLYI